MQLFYNPGIEESDKEIVFPRDESKHIARVLRKKEGDTLKVTNGKGALFTAEITVADQKQCFARIMKLEKEAERPYYLHMAVAPTKMNDRYEWFLEKATEIGIDEITPVICDHSERKVVKLNRFERVLQSAMKQSLHLSFPKLNEAVTFDEFMESEKDSKKFIAHCEEEKDRRSLKNEVKAGEKYTILIGPEGDFSVKEIERALKENWTPVSLGKSRLRTETAAIVACTTLALANED